MELLGYSKNDWKKHDSLKDQLLKIESSQDSQSYSSRVEIQQIGHKLSQLKQKECKDPNDCVALHIRTNYKHKYEKKFNLLKNNQRITTVIVFPGVLVITPYLVLIQSLPKVTTIWVDGFHLKELYDYYQNGVGLPIFSNISSLKDFRIILERETLNPLVLPSHLTEFRITGSGVGSESSIATAISKFTDLKTVDFSAFDEEDSNSSVWMNELAKKTSLINCSTLISENYSDHIAKIVENNQELKHLSLQCVTSECLETFQKALENSHSLEELHILLKTDEPLEDCLDSLHSILSINKSIKHLNLGFFNAQNPEKIFENLPKLNSTLSNLIVVAGMEAPDFTAEPLMLHFHICFNSINSSIIQNFNKNAKELLKCSRLIILLTHILPTFYIYGIIEYFLQDFSLDTKLLRTVLLDRKSIGFLTKHSILFDYQELIRNCSKYQKINQRLKL
ncbi:hypothetical protein BC833DRAFT_589451 [Globomyces pollinis-pini]|nr:hypothetical protein BC833DRAFT_589451 [Globomyces pollinis-pini]